MLPPPHEKREGMAKRVSRVLYGIRSRIVKGSENPQIYYTKLACLLQGMMILALLTLHSGILGSQNHI